MKIMPAALLAAILAIQLSSAAPGTPPPAPSSENTPALQARIAELEATVESLRRDNAALRQQFQSKTAASVPDPQSAPGSAKSETTAAPAEDSGGYWISSTGKRHNSNCRYYKTSKGQPGTATEGVACKVCGG